MSSGKFEADCNANPADGIRVAKEGPEFSFVVSEGGVYRGCFLSFEDALALAEFIVTELEEKE